MVGADQVRLAGDRAALASLQTTAVNPGTTFTWLPQPGQVIRQDQGCVCGERRAGAAAVRAGPRPTGRSMQGMPDGADVGELTRDLIALGYGAGLAPQRSLLGGDGRGGGTLAGRAGATGDRARSCWTRWCSSQARSGSRR